MKGSSRSKRARRAGELLPTLLERYGVARQVRAHKLVAEWPEIVGRRIAARAEPEQISGGVLWIRVENAAWLQELSLLRDELLSRVREALGGDPPVDDLKLRLARRGSRQEDRPTSRRPPSRPRLAARREPARGAELEAIEREVEAISDPDLRRAILRARRRIAR